MTINVGNMTATFSNSQINYTAIGLRIDEEGSPQNSNLFNFRVNTVTKFTTDKFGKTRILTKLDPGSNTKILQITNDCKDLLIAIPNKVTIKAQTAQVKNVAYTKTYSEGHITNYANNGNVVIDVSTGSVFHLKSNSNTITKLTLTTPKTLSGTSNVTYSISLVVKSISISNSVWDSANVIWANNEYPPTTVSSNVSVYTLFGMRGKSNNINNIVWFAFSSNKYLTIDTAEPPVEVVLRYSVDDTTVTVDTTLISVDSV